MMLVELSERKPNLGENYSPGGGAFIGQYCLPDTFKWSLTMTARIGEYEDNIFIPSSDSASFVIGTHYLSTDGLDILDDMTWLNILGRIELI